MADGGPFDPRHGFMVTVSARDARIARVFLFNADGSPLWDSPTTANDWSRDILYVTSSAHTYRVNQTFAYNFFVIWDVSAILTAIPFLRLQELNCDILDIARCNLKSIIQDGGCQTGSTCFSTRRSDSSAISTATPRFSEFRNQIVIFWILRDATGSQ